MPTLQAEARPACRGYGACDASSGLTAPQRGLPACWQPGRHVPRGLPQGIWIGVLPYPTFKPVTEQKWSRGSPAPPRAPRWRPLLEVHRQPRTQAPRPGATGWASQPALPFRAEEGSWDCQSLEQSIFLTQFGTQPTTFTAPSAKGTPGPPLVLPTHRDREIGPLLTRGDTQFSQLAEPRAPVRMDGRSGETQGSIRRSDICAAPCRSTTLP